MTEAAATLDDVRDEYAFLEGDDRYRLLVDLAPTSEHQPVGAGCDLALHCNGQLEEMREVASSSPRLEGEAARRCAAALARLKPVTKIEQTQARAQLSDLIATS